VRTFAAILDDWADAAHDEDRELDFDEENESDQEPGPCRAGYLALIERVNQAISDDPEDAGPALDDLAAIDRRADQLFVIDEPERQLHPRLVRSAAAWLSDETRFGSSHWLLATHSPLLLRLGGSVQYVYLRPGSAGSDGLAIESIDPASLYGLSVIAGEMGFDRGELLTSVGLVIFVEGETDKAVLEGLFDRIFITPE
jgi:hypothetical protein